MTYCCCLRCHEGSLDFESLPPTNWKKNETQLFLWPNSINQFVWLLKTSWWSVVLHYWEHAHLLLNYSWVIFRSTLSRQSLSVSAIAHIQNCCDHTLFFYNSIPSSNWPENYKSLQRGFCKFSLMGSHIVDPHYICLPANTRNWGFCGLIKCHIHNFGAVAVFKSCSVNLT